MTSLAHKMSRTGKPQRLARDPAVDQAIRNYLAIALRAQGVPGMLRHTDQNFAQEMGAADPVVQQTQSSLLSSHDPGDLLALIDQLQGHGFTPIDRPPQGHAPGVGHLLQLLMHLHGNITGHGDDPALPQPHPAVVQNYTPENLGTYNVSELVRRRLEPPGGPMTELYRNLRNLGTSRSHDALLHHLANMAGGYDSQSQRVSSAVAAHDITGQMGGDTANSVHLRLGDILRELHQHLGPGGAQ